MKDTKKTSKIQSNFFILYLFALIAHLIMFTLFLVYKVKIMMYFNVLSVSFYTLMLIAMKSKSLVLVQNIPVFTSIIEVILHQIFAIICVGNHIGFQLFFIMSGVVTILQDKSNVPTVNKYLTCGMLLIIQIGTGIYSILHQPIYYLPEHVQLILMIIITLSACLGIYSFSLEQWNLSEHYRSQIEEFLGERNSKILLMQEKIITNFADIVEKRDGTTGGHVKRTREYVSVIVDALVKSGDYKETLTPEYSKMIISAAPLHDIGKIAISDSILCKKEKLTESEYEVMKSHSVLGGTMLKELLGNLESKEYIQIATEISRSHHEKWNGCGYPDGLACESIPLSARIVAVADVFDALTSARSYKVEYSFDKVFELMQNESGKQFDPTIIAALLKVRPKIESLCKSFEV